MALDKLMCVLIDSGFTLRQSVELLAQFMEEEIPLYLECMNEEDGSMDPVCC